MCQGALISTVFAWVRRIARISVIQYAFNDAIDLGMLRRGRHWRAVQCYMKKFVNDDLFSVVYTVMVHTRAENNSAITPYPLTLDTPNRLSEHSRRADLRSL